MRRDLTNRQVQLLRLSSRHPRGERRSNVQVPATTGVRVLGCFDSRAVGARYSFGVVCSCRNILPDAILVAVVYHLDFAVAQGAPQAPNPLFTEDAYRRFDELSAKHIESLRRGTKNIQDARRQRDQNQVKTHLTEFDEALCA